MNNLFLRLKNLPFYLAYPLIFLSSFLLLIHFLSIVSIDEFQTIREYFDRGSNVLFCAAAPAFIVFYSLDNGKKAFAALFAMLSADLILFSLCGVHISFLLSVILSFVFCFLLGKTDLEYGFFACLLTGTVLAVVFGILYDYIFELLRALCGAVKGKGALFGAINNFYNIAFSKNLEELFYHKEYSGTTLINGNLISGVVDIFKANTQNPNYAVAKFLTGKYFENIFLTLGLFIALYSRFDKKIKSAFVLIALLAVVFGDTRLFSLFILLYNPMLYLCYLILIAISYLVSSMLDIRIGFIQNGSLFELFRYGNNYLYFILTGVVLIALTYFASSIILSKFDFQSRKTVPRDVKKIITALGGERNIERISGDKLYVKNPNLIDILKLDCDIHENLITLNYDDLELIKPYF